MEKIECRKLYCIRSAHFMSVNHEWLLCGIFTPESPIGTDCIPPVYEPRSKGVWPCFWHLEPATQYFSIGFKWELQNRMTQKLVLIRYQHQKYSYIYIYKKLKINFPLCISIENSYVKENRPFKIVIGLIIIILLSQCISQISTYFSKNWHCLNDIFE